MSKILDYCESLFEDIVALRRDLHMHPELGFEVNRTADVVAKELEQIGIKTTKHVGISGVTGDIEMPNVERRIALRADMDALPIQEKKESPYKSKYNGKAHMCGHDVHTAMLIGAAKVINRFRNELPVSVRFIFQPNEENLANGALSMIEDGVLEDVDEVYALHVWPLIEAGQFAICSGSALSQGDSFNIEIIGKGGHGAHPNLTIDPILIACQFVTSLQSIVARNIDPLEAAVISVTQINAGTTFNIIPSKISISGTVRTLKKEIQGTIRERMQEILVGCTSSHGADYNFSYREGVPVTHNHKQCVENALSVAKSLTSESNIFSPFPPLLASEDFGYYSQKIPACYIFLGAGNKKRRIINACHDPEFDVDEKCIKFGMAMLASLILKTQSLD